MRIAYLDCFAGISGDMLLGALLDAGVAPQILHDAVASLNLGASLRIEKVDRSGISSTKVFVLDNTDAIAETGVPDAHDHTHHKHEKSGHHHHGRHLSSIRK